MLLFLNFVLKGKKEKKHRILLLNAFMMLIFLVPNQGNFD